jgi:hypothetical protein
MYQVSAKFITSFYIVTIPMWHDVTLLEETESVGIDASETTERDLRDSTIKQ